MLSVDLKSLIGHLNVFCTTALESAAGMCVTRTHYEVTVEHFFAKLAEQPVGDFAQILRKFDMDIGRITKAIDTDLEQFPAGHQGKPTFSPLLMELFQDAWLVASIDLKEPQIRSGAVVLAFLAKLNLFASGQYAEFLKRISRDQLLRDFWPIVKDGKETTQGGPSSAGVPGKAAAPGQPTGTTAIERFCTDFTASAKAGKIDPVFGRDKEIRQMIDIFARRRKNNPICVGEPGVGKTAVVEGLALRVVEGDVPDILRNTRIVGLDLGLLNAGAGMKGEFENRLNAVINEVKGATQPTILFIDEAHTLIGSGAQAGGGDAANLLKPALARGELRTVAATTWSEYKKYFEKDAALARRFQLVKLDEPDVATATLILRGLKDKYEAAHKVTVRDDAIAAAAEMSDRYLTGRYLPDKAVDLLDTAAARVKVQLSAKPAVLEDAERTIQALERRKAALERDLRSGAEVDDDEVTGTEDALEAARARAADLTERWKEQQAQARKVLDLRRELETAVGAESLTPVPPVGEQAVEDADAQSPDAAPVSPPPPPPPAAQAEGSTDADKIAGSTENVPAREEAVIRADLEQATRLLEEMQGEEPLVKIEVDPDMIARVIADWTGIPAGKVQRDQARSVLNLARNLKGRIRGQDTAIDAIAQVVKASKAGLKDPQQPMGVFLLVGPSGVGKTETALAIADELFGGERNVVTINMSEFMEKHTVSRLIGSPPGYVGYGEGGLLTEAVRQKPYAAVLLDETEKAHPEVLNLFYQVFDKGTLSDGEGREVDFKNTILFLTSNLATDTITRLCAREPRPSAEEIAAEIRPELSKWFKPALLARMTIVPYVALPPEAMREIVMLKLDKIATRLMTTQKLQLQVSANVVDQIAARCTEVETGARNIDHILNGTVLPVMSQELLARMNEGDVPPTVQLDFGPEGEVLVGFGGERIQAAAPPEAEGGGDIPLSEVDAEVDPGDEPDSGDASTASEDADMPE